VLIIVPNYSLIVILTSRLLCRTLLDQLETMYIWFWIAYIWSNGTPSKLLNSNQLGFICSTQGNSSKTNTASNSNASTHGRIYCILSSSRISSASSYSKFAHNKKTPKLPSWLHIKNSLSKTLFKILKLIFPGALHDKIIKFVSFPILGEVFCVHVQRLAQQFFWTFDCLLRA
jgi:hypothetical protein